MMSPVTPFVSLSDLTRGRWGANSRLVDRVVAVTTAATTILPENPRRVSYLIINRATEAGSVGFAAGHTYSAGVLLPPEGGAFGMDYDSDGDAVGYAVYGVLASGAGDFYVLEVVLE